MEFLKCSHIPTADILHSYTYILLPKLAMDIPVLKTTPELSGSVGMTFAYGSEGPRIDSRLGQN